MEFRLSDAFTDSLGRLTGDEQKNVKTTAFDLQIDPVNPGMRFHKLDRAKDTKFWSVRVSRDIRLIVHKSASSLLLCYVDHHDAAYRWAERRKLERHPKTGAAQLVEVRETVREIAVPRYVEAEAPAAAPLDAEDVPVPQPLLFDEVADEDLLGYGVPEEWLDDVRVATEDTILELADHLPAEAAEALLELATGNRPAVPVRVPEEVDAFEHPDAQRRFRVMTNVEELERALEYPWEKWTVFLHPAQRQLVERDFNGPARVSGSAGTGKTIVALHRAVHLARADGEARVLLTTFSDTLANALRVKLRRLIGNEPRLGERIEVHSMRSLAMRLHETILGRPDLASEARVRELIAEASVGIEGMRFTPAFLWSEWLNVVDAWQLGSWEEYRDVRRLGRKTRLAEKQRQVLWSVFEQVRAKLESVGLVTDSGVFARLAGCRSNAHRCLARPHFLAGSRASDAECTCARECSCRTRHYSDSLLAAHFDGTSSRPFEHVVVDEAQDISVAQLRFLATLGSERPDALFFAGDLGQRIFQQPFSWEALGVDIRGRSSTLKINYCTSHQIRAQADRLLGLELADVDGIAESRRGTVSAFNSPAPEIEVADSVEEEQSFVAARLRQWREEGLQPHEIAIFVRSKAELPRARAAAGDSGLAYVEIGEEMETSHERVSISTMHLGACAIDSTPAPEGGARARPGRAKSGRRGHGSAIRAVRARSGAPVPALLGRLAAGGPLGSLRR